MAETASHQTTREISRSLSAASSSTASEQEVNPDLSSYHENGCGEAANGFNHRSGDNSSLISLDEEDAPHLRTIEAAMQKLHKIHADPPGSWDKALKHKHGVDVYVRKDIVNLDGRERKMPIYKGELLIEGFTPTAVFAVTGQRDLWDDWYDHGNLVADLNDRTSLTYMNMKPPGTARPRDVALVERVEVDEHGVITFCATSTESAKVPQVHGRTRAYMALNGWVLTPVQRNGGKIATQLCYYVQAEAQGLIPGAVSAKMLSRRPVAIYKIAEHLRKHGAPPNKAASSQQRAPNGAHTATAVAAGGAGGAVAGAHATNSSQAQAEALESTLPPQAPFDDTHSSAKALLPAKRKFEAALADTSGFSEAKDASGSSIFFKRRGDPSEGLPVVRGSAEIQGFSTEQILGTIASTSARRVWDEMYVGTSGAHSVNGADHAVATERRKGVHPHLPEQKYSLARAVFRDEAYSENGPLSLVSCSSDAEAGPSSPNAQAEYIGWRLTPSASSSVRAERIASLSTSSSSGELPDFVERILTTAEAGQPARLRAFLDKYGHAPYFLRWGKGKAALEEELEGESDIAHGRTAWRIGGDGKAAAAEERQNQQVAWLQWDDKMYPNGLALSGEADLKLSRIEGMDSTVQLAFPPDFSSSGFTLRAERASSLGAGEVSWNGEKVTESIAAPKGAAQQKGRPKPAAAAAAGAGAGAAAAGAAAKRSADPSSVQQKRSAALPPEDGPVAKPEGIQAQAADLATLHRAPRLRDGTRQLPEDAMLILTQDLYFTRSQMAVVGALMAIVFALARFA